MPGRRSGPPCEGEARLGSVTEDEYLLLIFTLNDTPVGRHGGRATSAVLFGLECWNKGWRWLWACGEAMGSVVPPEVFYALLHDSRKRHNTGWHVRRAV